MLIEFNSLIELSVIAVCIIGSIAVSMARNPDIFSPIKIYSFFNTFFYFDIFLSSYTGTVKLIYFLQCLIILIISGFEPKYLRSKIISTEIYKFNFRKAVILVWILTVIPLLSQIFIIKELGGVAQTIENIAYRVKYFEGRGYLPAINSFIIILNLIYFIIVIRNKNLKNFSFYILHFSLLVGMGLLSGSRSFIAMTMLVIIVIYNYRIKKIGLIKIIIVGSILASLVGVLGQLRNTSLISNGEVSLDNFQNSESLENSHFKYGLIPLEIITEATISNLQYGSTYFSLLTNFIPRSIYPKKLESGGIFFTRYYAGNAWGGYSNLATGAVTEGVINFGWVFGIFLGLSGMVIMYLLGFLLYSRTINNYENKSHPFSILLYIYAILLIGRYSYSEFSYLIFSFFLTIIMPYYLFIFFYKKSIKYNNKYYE